MSTIILSANYSKINEKYRRSFDVIPKISKECRSRLKSEATDFSACALTLSQRWQLGRDQDCSYHRCKDERILLKISISVTS